MPEKAETDPIPLPDQFSARIVRSDGETSKVFIDGLIQRLEDEDGENTVRIGRPDRGLAYTLSPTTKEYYEIPYTYEMAEQMGDPEAGDRWVHVGQETVNGIPCDKYEVRRAGSKRPGPSEYTYVDNRTGMRVRTVTLNRSGEQVLVVEWQDVELGPPDPKLFEVPEGYRRIEL